MMLHDLSGRLIVGVNLTRTTQYPRPFLDTRRIFLVCTDIDTGSAQSDAALTLPT